MGVEVVSNSMIMWIAILKHIVWNIVRNVMGENIGGGWGISIIGLKSKEFIFSICMHMY